MVKIDQQASMLHALPKPDAAKIDDVARQLEAQFAQMMIKSMRDASFGDDLFPEENQLFRDIYDQQLASTLTKGKGLGLAAMIARQLGQVDTQDTVLHEDMPRFEKSTHARPSSAYQQDHDAHTPESFVTQIWHHAQKAAHELGVNVRALIAQAALETGWGKHGIKREDGKNANNLFGIKASGWTGARTNSKTHEYRNGERQSEHADFRAYSSVAESFADYVRMLKQNPRYQTALKSGHNVHGFAHALQKAGYATDPSYAEKINAIANGPVLKQILAKMTGAIQHSRE